jgi:hypothetical protein
MCFLFDFFFNDDQVLFLLSSIFTVDFSHLQIRLRGCPYHYSIWFNACNALKERSSTNVMKPTLTSIIRKLLACLPI